jgi:hypothetical protein
MQTIQPRKRREQAAPAARCASCGTPLDAQYFDVSGIFGVDELPRGGVLAGFTVPAQYCGELLYFAQFSDLHAKTPAEFRTPDLAWRLLKNGQPVFPYQELKHVVNPWGTGCFAVPVRLEEGATIELVVRKVNAQPAETVKVVGGRLVGRYWFNETYSDVAAPCA